MRLRHIDVMDGDESPAVPNCFRSEPIAKTAADNMTGAPLGLRFWYWEEADG